MNEKGIAVMIRDEAEWAQQMFGDCELGDKRRTNRLIDIGMHMAKQVGNSLAKSCAGDNAALLGGYRFMRSDHIEPEAISEGGFKAIAKQAQEEKILLALEDTTTVSYKHAAASTLGITGSRKEAKRRGFLSHSVLLLVADSEKTLGLIDQQNWLREEENHGKKHQRKKRAYEDKESYKWETASKRTAERLGSAMERTISVCDRESDIYEYLAYKLQNKQRFVVRAKTDRRIENEERRLFALLEQEAKERFCYTVEIPQRGGRRARKAKVVIRSMSLNLLPPADSKIREVMSVNGILVSEIIAPEDVEPLRWVLLTTEPVDTAEQVRQVVRYYELRWRIEEYHKAWKSGVGVERQRFQSADNLERMLVITAFLAVRLLQLKEFMATPPGVPEPACDTVLTEDEWKVLWITTKRSTPPSTIPSVSWAYLAIARLGGFTDTKHTGRPGWDALWDGWFRLQERIEGYQLSKLNL